MLGQVALEEESGKATNGLGFAVVDRGPHELLEIATPRAGRAWVAPIMRGEYREAWAVTEPGAGSDVSRHRGDGRRATATTGCSNGEKWFVTSEGDPGFYIVLAVAEGEQTLFIVEPGDARARDHAHAGLPARPVPRPPPRDRLRDCRVPEANRIPDGGDAGAKEWFLVERLFIAARCCGAAQRLLDLASDYAQERQAFGSPIAEYQGVSFPLADSLTELLPRACSPTTRRTRSTRSRTARSCTARSRWRSCTRPRWPAGSPTARVQVARRARVHASRTRRRASTASCASTASGRERARSSG